MAAPPPISRYDPARVSCPAAEIHPERRRDTGRGRGGSIEGERGLEGEWVVNRLRLMKRWRWIGRKLWKRGVRGEGLGC